MKKVKLYQVPKGSKLFGFEEDQEPTVIIFDHIDGMYSYCYVEGDEEKIVRLSANTPLTKTDKGYYFEEGGTNEPAEMGADNA